MVNALEPDWLRNQYCTLVAWATSVKVQPFAKLEIELEDSSDEVIELHIQRGANHELVESIAIMCDEPKGFNRLGVLSLFRFARCEICAPHFL